MLSNRNYNLWMGAKLLICTAVALLTCIILAQTRLSEYKQGAFMMWSYWVSYLVLTPRMWNGTR